MESLQQTGLTTNKNTTKKEIIYSMRRCVKKYIIPECKFTNEETLLPCGDLANCIRESVREFQNMKEGSPEWTNQWMTHTKSQVTLQISRWRSITQHAILEKFKGEDETPPKKKAIHPTN